MDDLNNIGRHFSLRRYHSAREYKLFVSFRSKKKASAMWRLIWRKMKKNLFECRSNSKSSSMRFSYDPNSYSQNFDQGSSVLVDTQEFSRSFSARFAVPSRIFPKDDQLMIWRRRRKNQFFNGRKLLRFDTWTLRSLFVGFCLELPLFLFKVKNIIDIMMIEYNDNVLFN